MAKKEEKGLGGPRMTTPEGRLSYPALLAPKTTGLYHLGDYAATILFPKATAKETLKQMILVVNKMKTEFFGNDIPKMNWDAFRDGDEDENESSHGYIYIVSYSKKKPSVVKPGEGAWIKITEPSEIYAGCWVKANVSPYVYDKGRGSVGVSWTLNSVAFIRDDEPFGTRSNADDDFGTPPSGEAGGTVGELKDVPF